jgi:hypothetical protein
MDTMGEYSKRRLLRHEIVVQRSRVIYYFYGLTRWGVRRKVRKYFSS